MEAKYIYGIVGTSEAASGPGGISGQDEIYLVPYRDISAVVSDTPFVDYSVLPNDQVVRYLLRHQQMIERVMQTCTIIPMKLGTYAPGRGEVEDILARGYTAFKGVLERIQGKIELDVVASWGRLDSVLKRIGEEPEVKELKEKLLSSTEGISLEARMQVGGLVKEILDREKKEVASEIEAALKGVAVDFRKHSLMDDQMVLNDACLLDKDKKDQFEDTLHRLNERYHEEVDFRSVGPLPPYSFYTAEVIRMRFEDINWAGQKLGLPEVATRSQIEKAYRDLAFACHPDRNPELDSDKEFQEIKRACKLLLEYCQGENCSFREEDIVQNAIIVKV